MPGVDAAARVPESPATRREIVPWTDGEDPLDLLQLPEKATVAVSGAMTADHLLNLQSRGVTTVNATTVLREVFMVKDTGEIDQLRRAGQAIDTVHLQVPAMLQPGRTEADVAAELTELILADMSPSTS